MIRRPGAPHLPRWSLVAGLVIASAAAFAPAVQAGFLADDFILLRTIAGFDGIGWAFTHNDLGQAGDAGHFYRPLWVLWNVALERVFGAEALAFHLANLALFAIVTVEVWAIVRRLAGELPGTVAALAFALYPRHGESVSWISGSTDLVATAVGLAALMGVLARWRPSVRSSAAAGLAAAAALAKETAFVLPALAAVVLVGAASGSLGERLRRALAPVAAIAAAQLCVLAIRTAVLNGIGGYSDYPWHPLRAAAVAASYVLAAVTPPQLELLRHPALLLFPLAVLALLAWRLVRMWRRREQASLALVAVGTAWFVLALLPSLNLAIDLNTTNGERLLFLPSVGLAIGVAGLVPRQIGRRDALVMGAIAAAFLTLSIDSARNWRVADRLADRIVSTASAVSPRNGELVLLSLPENYRTAHVLPGVTIQAALERAGRADVRVAVCAPVYSRSLDPGAVVFRPQGDGSYLGEAGWAAPFDFPVLRDPQPLSPDCRYSKAGGESWRPGLRLSARAHPTPTLPAFQLAYFDGENLRRCC